MEGAKAAADPPAGGQLESALLHIMQQHHHQSLRQRQQTERANKNAVRSACRVGGHLVEAVDGGVQELFVNEERIELEARALLGIVVRYRKQTDQRLAATNAVNSVLKKQDATRKRECCIAGTSWPGKEACIQQSHAIQDNCSTWHRCN
uniref:Uncharacterized protein n=1 Tax=Avena sativa TaxID=4498 RepID=A0ACD5X160_AVESA